MATIISFCNQKGGVGKTTTAVNLAAYLANLGKKVLFIDFDPQGNATSALLGKFDDENNIYRAISDLIHPEGVLQKTSISNLDILASHQDLAGANVELVNVPNREFKLKSAIEKLDRDYDYIFIDCPPSLGLLTVNALSASNKVLIPLQCEYYALEGLTSLLNTVDLIKQSLNPDLSILGILLTMMNLRNKLSREIFDEVKRNFPHYTFETIIPRNTALAEAPSFSKTILEYAPQSKGAQAYQNLANEILKILEPNNLEIKNLIENKNNIKEKSGLENPMPNLVEVEENKELNLENNIEEQTNNLDDFHL